VLAKPSVKQHLAAIRMLCDYLVTGSILPFNPASSVRGPKYVQKRGKTPVLDDDQMQELLDSIDVSTLMGLRDRALIGVMAFNFSRVGATIAMGVGDYFQQGKKWWFRLHEKGAKHHQLPAHHRAEEFMDAYLDALRAAGAPLWRDTPLFRTGRGRSGALGEPNGRHR
jgi:site-specific recombinase XerC